MNRASPANLALNLLAFGVFMILLLVAVGSFGVGIVELLLWLALVAAGAGWIVRRHQHALRQVPQPHG